MKLKEKQQNYSNSSPSNAKHGAKMNSPTSNKCDKVYANCYTFVLYSTLFQLKLERQRAKKLLIFTLYMTLLCLQKTLKCLRYILLLLVRGSRSLLRQSSKAVIRCGEPGSVLSAYLFS